MCDQKKAVNDGDCNGIIENRVDDFESSAIVPWRMAALKVSGNDLIEWEWSHRNMVAKINFTRNGPSASAEGFCLLWNAHWTKKSLPFSALRRFRSLHSLTEHTDNTMAATKNRIPPTTPAAIALSRLCLVTGPGTSMRISADGDPTPSGDCENTRILINLMDERNERLERYLLWSFANLSLWMQRFLI